jgi:hypothetical protein
MRKNKAKKCGHTLFITTKKVTQGSLGGVHMEMHTALQPGFGCDKDLVIALQELSPFFFSIRNR